ncbi:adenylyl-sulfate kinase [Desulfoluna spongiiphila]|uniref:Adenylyl-sulfate kinase n=1 Tax=Desulfoluna spongiiphila TaxID=419481 RepID=A0A1G5HXP8_9BACT|nr:adenylyl-sulfate kinase [Desulfoluna spongiiphila]SCY68494.1 adenylylsulfate kinase [Desulfoluna spongiiphila]
MIPNCFRHRHAIKKVGRAEQKNQSPCVLWFTGLSGSGKSTLAGAVDEYLFDLGCHSYLMDGDNVRYGLNRDLALSDEDRAENIRRIGEVSKLFVDAGLITLCAFISPFAKDRNRVRSVLDSGEFIEVHVSTPLEECKQRDPKGLYKKALKGDIHNFTGLDGVYEVPVRPEITIDTTGSTPFECAEVIVEYLRNKRMIPDMGNVSMGM